MIEQVNSAARDVFHLLGGALRIARRRRRYGPLRPSWSFAQETVLEVLRRETARTDWQSRRLEARRRDAVDVEGVDAEWIGDERASRTILFLHGGGYTVGSVASHRWFIERVGRGAGARVLAPDYRLAPEHPFPGAVEDAVAVYRWLLASGVAAERLAVIGESAGGGLAVAMLVAAREQGLAMPSAIACISPWCDLGLTGGSIDENARFDWLSVDGLRAQAAAYLAGADPRSPLASPLFASLAGLPPLLIQVGALEVLRDDGVRISRAAETAGVQVELEVWSEMFHSWHLFPRLRQPEADMALARMVAFVQRRTSPDDRR